MATDDETSSADDSTGTMSPMSRPQAPEERLAIAPGDSVGRFTIRGRLGAGGMGEVFSAHDPELDRLVALKFIRGSLGSVSSETRARFQREAQVMARLSHPNVVAVHEVGTFGDALFVVMELVPGPTLSAWLAEEPREWPEIVAVFLEAGRGLAAAHAAGIVHRDFKPSNVIIGDRVRVADFGLARGARDADDAPTQPSTIVDDKVTRTGGVLGTPAYMSPEQRAGEVVTPLSDQYSFALSLGKALEGKRYPAWLRAIVERGTRPAPEDRYPSMTALLRDLGRDPGRMRRRLLYGAAVLGVVAIAFAVEHRFQPPTCGGDEALIAPLWDQPTRDRVQAAFLRSGRPYAADTFQRVDAAVEQRLGAWAVAHHDACAATHERHEQSEALLDLRMQCLLRGRDDAATLLHLLGEADAAAVDRAVSAVTTVADPTPCADVAALTAVVPPPRDPTARREDGAIRLEAGRAVALARLGRVQEALAAAAALPPRAQALDAPGALSEALYAVTFVDYVMSRFDAAVEHGFQAERAADLAHDDARRGEALTMLAYVLGRGQHRFPEALAVARVAGSAIERVGNPARLAHLQSRSLGVTLEAKGDYTAALAHYLAALGWAIREGGWPSRPLASAFEDLSGVEMQLGDLRAAGRDIDAAIRVYRVVVGPEHVALAVALAIRGDIAIQLGDYEAGAEANGHANQILERTFGPEHETIGLNLVNIAAARLCQNRLDEALADEERGMAILKTVGSTQVADALDIRGLILARRGQLDAALALEKQSLALRAKTDSPDSTATAQTEVSFATMQLWSGHVAEAHATLRHAIGVFTKSLGAENPATAGFSTTLAEVAALDGNAGDGADLCAKAVPILEAHTSGDTPDFIDAERRCASAFLAAGQAARALALAARADRLATDGHRELDVLAAAREVHARALFATDPIRACALGREARALDGKLAYSFYRPALDRWLGSSCDGRNARR